MSSPSTPAFRYAAAQYARRAAALALVLGLAACGTSDLAACHVAADCASGVCRSDGSCAAAGPDASPVTFGDAAVRAPDAKGTDAQGKQGADALGHAADAAADGSQSGVDGGPVACTPNGDGVVTRSEVPFLVGAQAHWRAAAHVPFDTAGVAQADGARAWDASTQLPGDKAILLHTDALEGAWFADQFPGATYASRLSQESDLIGVFQVTADALLLRGVVSPTDGLTRTLLTYSPPVPMLAFPLTMGAHWQQTATVSGQAQGLLVGYAEAYDLHVDAHGTFATPLGKFPVLRVRVAIDRPLTLLPSRRSLLFVAECMGTIAAIDLESSDPASEPTSAASLRRIAPAP